MSNPDRISCSECRYYSSLIARAYVCTASHVEALCLNDQSPFAQQYMRENGSCCFAERGGPVDEYDAIPGE